MWGFGVPLGDLYPVLGDLGYCTLRGFSLDPETAYAWIIAMVMGLGSYASYALARRIEIPGYSAWSHRMGCIAAICWTLDIGASREGGWVYTVIYGVWPQALATSLVWLGLVNLDRSVSNSRYGRRAALLLGAGLLAHPIALLHLVPMVGLWALFVGDRRASLTGIWSVGLGVGLSAVYWLPMLELRDNMAGYGWVYRSSQELQHWLLRGRWFRQMPSLFGYAAILGVIATLFFRHRWSRFLAAGAIALWFATSRSLFEGLRLELWSSGFTKIQYQRFMICAKPAIFAMTAFGLTLPIVMFDRAWSRKKCRLRDLRSEVPDWKCASLGLLLLLLGMFRLEEDLRFLRHRVEKVQGFAWPLKRSSSQAPGLEADYQAFLRWAKREHEAGHHYRFHVLTSRHDHNFMDITALAGHEVYKSGFTPADNFKHKPESRDPAVLDRLALTHELRKVAIDAPLVAGALRWGRIQVRPIPTSPRRAEAVELSGTKLAGSVGFSQTGPMSFGLEVSDTTPTPYLVQLPVAYYPRWKVRTKTGQELETLATPILGPWLGPVPNTPPGRWGGNDGRQPTLLSFRSQGPGGYEVSYQTWRVSDRLGLGISLFCLVSLCFTRPPRLRWIEPRRLAVMGWLAAAIAVMLRVGMQWPSHAKRWSERLDEITVLTGELEPAIFRSNMALERALVAKVSVDQPVRFQITPLPDTHALELWWSLEDDRGIRTAPEQTVYHVELRGMFHDGKSTVLLSQYFRHRPNRHAARIDLSHLKGGVERLEVSVSSNQTLVEKIAWSARPVEASDPLAR